MVCEQPNSIARSAMNHFGAREIADRGKYQMIFPMQKARQFESVGVRSDVHGGMNVSAQNGTEFFVRLDREVRKDKTTPGRGRLKLANLPMSREIRKVLVVIAGD